MSTERTPQQVQAHQIIQTALERAAELAGPDFVIATMCAAVAAECELTEQTPEQILGPFREAARNQVAAMKQRHGLAGS